MRRRSEFFVKNKAFGILAGIISLLVAAVPLAAHHGSAGYDLDKELTMKGTVTQWLWANPHCFLKYDTTDDKGGVVHWAAEVSNPIDMTRRGWSRNTLNTGDQVTVTVRPAKNGLPVGQLMKVVLPNGKELIGWNPSVR
jgi:Family of unknown function (DUF6152)